MKTIPVTANGDPVFLSHLSGDEVYADIDGLDIEFLSHLSGDEVTYLTRHWDNYFLSHLSGDEELSKTY